MDSPGAERKLELFNTHLFTCLFVWCVQVRKLEEVSTLLPPCGFQGPGPELTESAGLAVSALYKLMFGARCSFFFERAESKTLAESRSERHTKGISAEGHGSMMAGDCQ